MGKKKKKNFYLLQGDLLLFAVTWKNENSINPVKYRVKADVQFYMSI